MSFFNFRRGGTSSKSSSGKSAPAESLEIVRKRAKHRLIGSAVLVLLGVIGFPLLFDTQPRPVSVGIPIEIPSKQAVKPFSLPASVDAPAAVPAAAPESTVVAITVPATPELPAPAQAPAATPSTPVTPPPAVAATPAKAPDEADRVKGLLEGRATTVAASTSADLRMVVQVGAFADSAKAREVRLKLERAGLKTYTQVANTKDGKRIRVRVGPYPSKAEADKAAKQIRALNLPAAILTL